MGGTNRFVCRVNRVKQKGFLLIINTLNLKHLYTTASKLLFQHNIKNRAEMYSKNKSNHGSRGRNNSGRSFRRSRENSNNSNYRTNNEATNNQSRKSEEIQGRLSPTTPPAANADSNLSKWIEAIQPFLESLFGHLASFIYCDRQIL